MRLPSAVMKGGFGLEVFSDHEGGRTLLSSKNTAVLFFLVPSATAKKTQTKNILTRWS